MIKEYFHIDQGEKELYKKLFFFSLFFHLIAVFFSEGFHRPDEHLGMLRYVFLKLGEYPASELSWEYPAKIRNWLQPGFYYIYVKAFKSLGVDSPYFLVGAMRFLTSMISLYTLAILSKISFRLFEDVKSRKIFHYCLYGIWFFPFMHARSTAETFGGIFMVGGIYFLLKKLGKDRITNSSLRMNDFSRVDVGILNSLMGGLFLGLVVNFRIPLAPFIPAFFLWLFIFAKINYRSSFLIIVGTILSIVLTGLADSWGYGEWTYSTYNYLYQEFTRSVSSGFGISPWYYYFTKVFSKGTPPMSLFFLASFLFVWIKKPGHWITALSLPIFALHSVIGHKELRYIFPLAIFLPFTLTYLFESSLFKAFSEKYSSKKAWGFAAKLIISVNLIFLIISSVKPAYSPIGFYKFIYSKKTILKVYTLNIVRDKLRVYLPTDIPFQHVKEDSEVVSLIKDGESSWFLMNKVSDIENFEKITECNLEYLTYPKWVLNYSKYFKRSKIWAMYNCNKKL